MSSPHAAFIAGLPKAELHVHHVGSASPRIVSELAARHPGTVPSDLEELKGVQERRAYGVLGQLGDPDLGPTEPEADERSRAVLDCSLERGPTTAR